MTSGKVSLTKEGYEKLKEELNTLKDVRRPEVIKRIKEAREYGDLSENAEYDNAKNEQSFIEGRIAEIEDLLRSAQLIRENHKKDKISLGSKVLLESDGEKFEYVIVGSNEANPSEGRISNESAIGQALLGKGLGDSFVVEAPDGEIKYKIKSVS